METGKRIGEIDFWRGAVLIAIFIDHIPGNGLESVTPRNFGLSDSAEAFVFLSGLSVGLIYLPRAQARGWLTVARGCLRRALKLYGVHIALTLSALAIFAAAYRLSGLDDLIEAHGRAFVFFDPPKGLAGLGLMSLQLGYFNILPLYIVLMVWAPLAVALAMNRPRLALAVSIGLYALSRLGGVRLPNWPEPGTWFFNPFAWQLIFTIGVICALLWRTAGPRPLPGLTAASAAIVALAAFAVTGLFGLAPQVGASVVDRLDVVKQDLGLARLVHFLALAYLVAICPAFRTWTTGPAGRAVQGLGRHSLSVFAAGSILSALGQVLLQSLAGHMPADLERESGFAYTMAGIVVLFMLVRWIEYRAPPGSPPAFATPQLQGR